MKYFIIGALLLLLSGCAITNPSLTDTVISNPKASYQDLFLLGVL